MAKAVEDTAFYRYHRLIALNEVGGDPAIFGTSVEEFHRDNLERLRSWPLSMLTTATHDTKRGEDARARLCVLTEMPDEWQRAVTRWARTLSPHRSALDGVTAPSRPTEYMIYQALVGAWPFGWDGRRGRESFAERLIAFLEKALREAKEDTSWTRPNAAYEEATRRFVLAALEDTTFVEDLAAFCRRLDPYGATNALGQTLLRLTCPGVPDTYQGSELWNQSFVDPDNRAPVDFTDRRRRLEGLRRPGQDRRTLARERLDRWVDGELKLYVTHVALEARRAHPDLFLRGEYDPLSAGDHVVAFARSHGKERVVVAVPRLSAKLTKADGRWPIGAAVWGSRRVPVPAGRYVDALTGRSFASTGALRAADLFEDLPLCLLLGTSPTRTR
jgi:(1->4)-alpha-D-glucan 1-alpha-D-glucosylmutase